MSLETKRLGCGCLVLCDAAGPVACLKGCAEYRLSDAPRHRPPDEAEARRAEQRARRLARKKAYNARNPRGKGAKKEG